MFKRIALFTLFLTGIAGVSQAYVFERNPDRNVFVRYTHDVAATVTSTNAIVVDLSDSTNFPHGETRELRVNWARISLDKTAASTATVKLGVVNYVGASTGSVTWFHVLTSSNNVSNTNIESLLDVQPSWVSLKVIPGSGGTDGSTPYLISNDKTTGSGDFQNDLELTTTYGDAAPNIGDLVVTIDNVVGNTLRVLVELIYHTVKK